MNKSPPVQISLQDLTGLVNRYVSAEDDVEAAEEALKQAKAKLALYQDNLIPNVLRELDMPEIRLPDGRTVTCKMNVSCKVDERTMPDAEKWLAERDLDSIIKHQVITEFGKGENELAKEIYAVIEKALEDKDKLPFTYIKDQKTIHFQTLAAMVREQMGKGVDVPEEPFQLFVTDRATIKTSR